MPGKYLHFPVKRGAPKRDIQVLAGVTGLERAIHSPYVLKTGLALVGYEAYLQPGRVLVLGGGDVAIDVARTALRNGAAHVTVAFPEAEAEMRAAFPVARDVAPVNIRRALAEVGGAHAECGVRRDGRCGRHVPAAAERPPFQ